MNLFSWGYNGNTLFSHRRPFVSIIDVDVDIDIFVCVCVVFFPYFHFLIVRRSTGTSHQHLFFVISLDTASDSESFFKGLEHLAFRKG